MPFTSLSIADVYLIIESSIVDMQLFRIDSDNRTIFLMQLLYLPGIFSLQIDVEIKFIPKDRYQKRLKQNGKAERL